MLRSVAVLLQDPVAPFELGVVAEVFGTDRTDDGVPAFDYLVCAERPGRPLSAGRGLQMVATSPLSAAAAADLVALPSSSLTEPPSAAVRQAVREAHERGAYVLSVCSGAFAVAHSGIADGRRLATHWRYADRLAAAFPDVVVDRDSLYCQDGSLVSGAGTAAGIDACLHLVRTEHGPAVANRIARRMVVPAHRHGGQRQFVDAPVVADPDRSVQPVLDWIEEHLADPLTVEVISRAANMSVRTLLRRFADETGTSPTAWVIARRVARAQQLLEHGTAPVEEVARRSGLGNAAALRHHFRHLVGVTPTQFRRQFAARA